MCRKNSVKIHLKTEITFTIIFFNLYFLVYFLFLWWNVKCGHSFLSQTINWKVWQLINLYFHPFLLIFFLSCKMVTCFESITARGFDTFPLLHVDQNLSSFSLLHCSSLVLLNYVHRSTRINKGLIASRQLKGEKIVQQSNPFLTCYFTTVHCILALALIWLRAFINFPW